MDELEKLAFLIAEEFVKAFEGLEMLLGEEDAPAPVEVPLTRVAGHSAGRR